MGPVLSSSFRSVEPPQVVAKRTVEDCDAVSGQLHDECRSETVGTKPPRGLVLGNFPRKDLGSDSNASISYVPCGSANIN